MPTAEITRELAEKSVNAVNDALKAGHSPKGVAAPKGQMGALAAAADNLGVSRKTFHDRVTRAEELYDLAPDWTLCKTPETSPEQDILRLKDEVRSLKSALISVQREEVTREAVRAHIFKLIDTPAIPPKWTIARKSADTVGVPTLFCSDWHWGERVNPDEIMGANQFDMQIAHKRVRKLVEKTVFLLFDCLKAPKYDGLVLLLGGDFVTGDIHEELTSTNAAPIMPTVIDLYESMIWMIDELLKHFPAIDIKAVTGNHGRNTKKIQKKERAATNFDWLVYTLLDKHYEKDNRVTFDIPAGADCRYSIYGHKYLLSHGDQFRGGDGLIGPIGPLTRGAHKKASRDASLQHSFDTMVVGHFHTLMQLPHLIVNGSLKGMDEFAFQNNYSFERPSQALWITHPREGITFQLPVYADEANV